MSEAMVSNTKDIIYVKLTNEMVDVYRPVEAHKIHDMIYKIIDSSYDRNVETWEFEPNSIVVCASKTLSGEDIIIAQKLIK